MHKIPARSGLGIRGLLRQTGSVLLFCLGAPAFAEVPVERHPLLEDAGIALYAWQEVAGARSLAFAGEIDTLFVGTRSSVVYAIHDDVAHIIAANRKVPNGIAWNYPYLFIAEQDALYTSWFREFSPGLHMFERLSTLEPDIAYHGWRYVAVHPVSQKIYVSVGAPCNLCYPKQNEGSIISVDPRSGRQTTVATGIRNSVGMAFAPWDNALWFTDNGVDMLGEDIPPDELNRLHETGSDFGFPAFAGGDVSTGLDPGELSPVMPVATFSAHTAPLGLHFYTHGYFPALRGWLLVALHGSWNRREPDGYRIEALRIAMTDNRVIERIVLLDGFLQLESDTEPPGRPVDITSDSQGRILISDDRRGVIYRLDYAEPPL